MDHSHLELDPNPMCEVTMATNNDNGSDNEPQGQTETATTMTTTFLGSHRDRR